MIKPQNRAGKHKKKFAFDSLDQKLNSHLRPFHLLALPHLVPPTGQVVECQEVPASKSEKKIRIDDAQGIRKACAKRGPGFSPRWGGKDGQKARIVGWLKETGHPLNRAQIFQECYKFSGNPLFLWMIFLECRARNAAIPEHVLNYFEAVADDLWKSACRGRPEKPLAEILKFKKEGKTGRGTVFSKFADIDGLKLALSVHEKMKAGRSKTAAIGDVADEKIHGAEPTVRRAWKKFARIL